MTEEEKTALLIRLDERSARVEKALFGNGQPGLLVKVADHDARLDAFDVIYRASQVQQGPLMQEYGALKDTVAALEEAKMGKTKQGAIVGAGGGLGALLGLLLPFIGELLKRA